MTVGNCIPIDYARGVLGGPDCFEMHRCEGDWFNRLDENSNEKDNQSDQVAHPFSVPINSKIPFFLSPEYNGVMMSYKMAAYLIENFSNPLHWPALNRQQDSPSPRASAVDQFSPCVAEGKLIDRVTLAGRLENERPWI